MDILEQLRTFIEIGGTVNLRAVADEITRLRAELVTAYEIMGWLNTTCEVAINDLAQRTRDRNELQQHVDESVSIGLFQQKCAELAQRTEERNAANARIVHWIAVATELRFDLATISTALAEREARIEARVDAEGKSI